MAIRSRATAKATSSSSSPAICVADITVEPPPPSVQLAHGLLVPPAVDQPQDIAPNSVSDAQRWLLRLEPVLVNKPVRPFDTTHQ